MENRQAFKEQRADTVKRGLRFALRKFLERVRVLKREETIVEEETEKIGSEFDDLKKKSIKKFIDTLP